MTNEERSQAIADMRRMKAEYMNGKEMDEVAERKCKSFDIAIQALSQEPCEMTAEEYRQRIIQAFHNADCDELITVCVLPTEKEFEHLEWLLKNHYKKDSCDDAVSREAVLDYLKANVDDFPDYHEAIEKVLQMSSVTQKRGKWIPVSERLPEDGTYLVTAERIVGTPRIDIKSFAKDLNKVDEFDFPKHKCGWYDYDSECGYWEDTKVIAWMPLPEPYEPQESEDQE